MQIEVKCAFYEGRQKDIRWFAGTITRISGGTGSYKKSAHSKSNRDVGFCLVRWGKWKVDDADGAGDDEYDESGNALKAPNFNTERSSAWRLDLV